MRISTPLIALLFIFSYSTKSAIYGEDERQLIFNNINEEYRSWAGSILAQLRPNSLQEINGASYLRTKPLKDHVTNLCEDAPFAGTPTFSKCTAFLVAPDLIVTAGHCINNQIECLNARWIFTSEVDPNKTMPIIPKRDQVKCKKLLAHRKNSISKNDYALIQLENNISHRNPLSYRKNRKIETTKEALLVIGHPTGLPLISTDQGIILENRSKVLFKISSDTFGGNSGSPVINPSTGLVEGILTDGDLDYTLDKEKGCIMPYQCGSLSKCKGENVVRITNIELLAPEMEPIIDPIFNPRTPRL